ncbi:MAG: gamma-glutamylcyclotransferase family protein [Polaromonas sp.]
MSLPPVRHVFVYGTLRQGQLRDINRLQPAPRWVGNGCVSGMLYHLGAYPGLVLGGPGSVHGEVYEISAELERQLDEIEDVWPQQSGEYCKREIAVRLEGAASQAGRMGDVACLVYEMALERISGMPVIACGDWTQYRAAAQP